MAKAAGNSLRSAVKQAFQVFHGDRDREAKALVDRMGGDVPLEEAKEAVRRTHGDVAGGVPSGEHPQSDTATPDDVRAIEREHENRG